VKPSLLDLVIPRGAVFTMEFEVKIFDHIPTRHDLSSAT
jgi:hypothetical protein